MYRDEYIEIYRTHCVPRKTFYDNLPKALEASLRLQIENGPFEFFLMLVRNRKFKFSTREFNRMVKLFVSDHNLKSKVAVIDALIRSNKNNILRYYVQRYMSEDFANEEILDVFLPLVNVMPIEIVKIIINEENCQDDRVIRSFMGDLKNTLHLLELGVDFGRIVNMYDVLCESDLSVDVGIYIISTIQYQSTFQPFSVNALSKLLLHTIKTIEIDIDDFKAMIKLGANINSYKNDLYLNSCCCNRVDIVKYLLDELGCDLHYNGGSALTVALKSKALEVIKFLFERKILINFDDFKAMIESGADINSYKNDLYLNSCCCNRVDIVKYLLDELRCDLHYNGGSALTVALKSKALEVVKFLLERKILINFESLDLAMFDSDLFGLIHDYSKC